jgi:hypothetical protein
MNESPNERCRRRAPTYKADGRLIPPQRQSPSNRFCGEFRPCNLEMNMGKYFLGWLLGVPVVVLVLIYLVFHH